MAKKLQEKEDKYYYPDSSIPSTTPSPPQKPPNKYTTPIFACYSLNSLLCWSVAPKIKVTKFLEKMVSSTAVLKKRILLIVLKNMDRLRRDMRMFVVEMKRREYLLECIKEMLRFVLE